MEFRTKGGAIEYLGGLSEPAKMPCPAFNLQPLVTCPNGRKLCGVRGSICERCYGTNKRSRYVARGYVMVPAWQRRLAATQKEFFVDAMVRLMRGLPYFRWHDTGDVYSRAYWACICAIAERCPETRFWLPTKEYGLLGEKHPGNLMVRFSAPLIDTDARHVERMARRYRHISTVSTHDSEYRCRSTEGVDRSGVHLQMCNECRDCWDDTVPIVDYRFKV